MPNRGNLNKYINMATFKTRIPNRGLLNKFKNGGNTPFEINTTGKKYTIFVLANLRKISKLHNFSSQQQN